MIYPKTVKMKNFNIKNILISLLNKSQYVIINKLVKFLRLYHLFLVDRKNPNKT